MKSIKRIKYALVGFFVFVFGCSSNAVETESEKETLLVHGNTNKTASTLTIPMAGNAYVTKRGSGGTEVVASGGLANWSNPNSVFSAYFRVELTESLTLKLKGYVASGSSTVRVTVNGAPFIINLNGSAAAIYNIGTFKISSPGYIKVDFQGVSKTGNYFGDISALVCSSLSAGANVNYADDPANFYWSRRGPSVHLNYDYGAPVTDNEWNYNEVTVPVGEDKIGSYYMSNGFGEGYFGIQVNSATERRILFSVWDAANGKTTLVKKGANVVVNDFGGEGTGGQSYLLFNWKVGNTYKFLNRAKPDGLGNTIYSAWFYAPEINKWTFIASWKRPNISTYLKGFHSFLENFYENEGYQGRKAKYDNQWVRTVAGVWIERTTGRFTVDATGANKQRMDFAGGVENGGFYLQNGGFFATYVNPNTIFTRAAKGNKPTVDLTTLP